MLVYRLICSSAVVLVCLATTGNQSHGAGKKAKVVKNQKILDATEEDLKAALALIEYVGPTMKSSPSITFFTKDCKPSEDLFNRLKPVWGSSVTVSALQFSVTPKEFQKMLTAVKPLVVKAGAKKDNPHYLAFRVIRETKKGYESHVFWIARPSAIMFYGELIVALEEANEGRKRLAEHRDHILSSRR